MMDVYLHTELQHSLEQSQLLIDEATVKSLASAKRILQKSLSNPLLQLDAENVMLDRWSDDIKCARGLLNFFLGQVFAASIQSDTDVSVAVENLQSALELFEGVSNEGVKLKFLNVLQQTYNMIGQVIAQYQQD